MIIEAVGEDVNREGLQERLPVARRTKSFSGLGQTAGTLVKLWDYWWQYGSVHVNTTSCHILWKAHIATFQMDVWQACPSSTHMRFILKSHRFKNVWILKWPMPWWTHSGAKGAFVVIEATYVQYAWCSKARNQPDNCSSWSVWDRYILGDQAYRLRTLKILSLISRKDCLWTNRIKDLEIFAYHGFPSEKRTGTKVCYFSKLILWYDQGFRRLRFGGFIHYGIFASSGQLGFKKKPRIWLKQ